MGTSRPLRHPITAGIVVAVGMVIALSSAAEGGLWSGGYGPDALSSSVSLAVDGNGTVLMGTYGGGAFAASSAPASQMPSWNRVPSGTDVSRFLQVLARGPGGSVYAEGFTEIFAIAPGGASTAISANPFQFNGGTYAMAVDGSGSVYVGTYNGAFKHAPGDADWTALPTQGLPNNNYYMYRIAADAIGTLYVNTSDGVFRLANGGASWTSTTAPVSLGSATYTLVVDANGTAWAGTYLGIFYLPPASTTWTAFNDGLGASLVQSITFDSAGTLYAGTNTGVWSTGTAAPAWTQLVTTGLPSGGITSVAVDGVGRVYAAATCAVYVLPVGGTVWGSMYGGINSNVTNMALYPTGVLYGVTQSCGPVKRTPGGGWSTLTTNGLNPYAVAALALDTSLSPTTGTLYASSYSGTVSKLASGGATWTDTSPSPLPSYAYVLTVDDSGQVYAGTVSNGVFTLPQGESTWTQLPLAGLANPQILSLVVRSTGQVVCATADGDFRLDSGATFWQPTGGLTYPGSPLTRDGANNIYTNDGSALAKLASGTSLWKPVPALANPGPVSAAQDGTLFAASYSGVYELAAGTAAWAFLGMPPVSDFNPGPVLLDPTTKILHVSVPYYGVFELQPQCFDAVIDVGEECDPFADPTGCAPDASCTSCMCVTTTTTTSSSMAPTTSSSTTVPTTSSSSLPTTSSSTTVPTTSSSTIPTTTSSTALQTTTTIAPTTTSSTAAPSSTTTSTVSTSSSTTAGEASTTSSTAVPTTSTTIATCGDGVKNGVEQCDYADPAISVGCCTTTCALRSVGYPCGDDSADDCDEPDSCDGAGHCRANHIPTGTQCRAAGDAGECDVGAACDGSAECPPTGKEDGCSAIVPADAVKVIGVDCKASTEALQGGTSLCDATGFDDDASGRSAARAATANSPVTKPLKAKQKKLKQVKGQALRVGHLTLHLNKLGKQLQAQRGGVLRVRLVTTIRNGGTDRSPIVSIVSVRKR